MTTEAYINKSKLQILSKVFVCLTTASVLPSTVAANLVLLDRDHHCSLTVRLLSAGNMQASAYCTEISKL